MVATISMANNKLIDSRAMISQTQLDYFKEVGIWYTGVPAMDSSSHIASLKRFLSKPEDYKQKFLQKEFDYAFEGYSFLGQEDSLNQGEEDKVFTYVLSDFFDSNRHPIEFHDLISSQKEIIRQVSTLERSLIKSIDENLLSFFENQLGHMLSANFYPPTDYSNLRLTAHPDVSFLTVFPFGIDKEFQFELSDGTWQSVKHTNEIIVFSGYLLESVTGIKALNHKVEKKGKQDERFSFAYFSVPKPSQQFKIKNEIVSSEDFFARYLSLFD